jgi:DNA helicase-2/ATP-dependent DNA helicase PcrA
MGAMAKAPASKKKVSGTNGGDADQGRWAEFMRRYEGLNPEQREAVDALEGPVMVIAGPGTGKTEVLAMRVANILRKDENAASSEILCLTFTDAAAWNMRNRLAGFIGRDAYRVAIHTFHSFGVEIMNRYPERFHRGAAFSPADDITQYEILEDIFKSLDYNDPLRSEHDDRFVYIRPAKNAIDNIKKAGLTPDDFDRILQENEAAIKEIDPLIVPIFGERISKKLVPKIEVMIKSVRGGKYAELPGGFDALPLALADALEGAIEEVAQSGKTTALTAWKAQWTSKGDDKLTHLADREDAEKIASLARIYREYIARMSQAGYYDFNDMILDVLAALREDPSLQAEIADRYRYILVDEFQDTNNAQLQFVELVAQSTHSDEQPNIMVVGDDDQAIFKFQGAEIRNIAEFKKKFPNPHLVVLTSNYRSTQDILDLARRVIKRGAERLEKIEKDLKKELIASKKDIGPGEISGKRFPTRDLEYQWIVREVKRLREKGVPAKQIAVIAREHKYLEGIVNYFHGAKVPVAYEREENVLQMEPVRQLITMAEFVDSIMRRSKDKDELLPQILNYPFWGLAHSEVWELSLKAAKEYKPWLQAMRESGGKLNAIAEFFIDLGGKAANATAEEILHELIGGPQLLSPESENEDGDDFGVKEGGDVKHEMFSPFRAFYFGERAFADDRAQYLRFLSALRSFIGTLREYHSGRPVTTAEMIEFVKVHDANKLAINNFDAFASATDAVQLMVAHKAKGLEFEAVFVINCEEDVWASSGKGTKMPLPSNLPISPARDTHDDQLRLFYVALTRSKRLLYLTAAGANERGKKADALSFLVAEEGEEPFFDAKEMSAEDFVEKPEDLLIGQITLPHLAAFTEDERALFMPTLEKYQLSVTHLHNFLNVASAGPAVFFQRNLLRFPEPLNASAAFGNAVHETIKEIYIAMKNDGTRPSVDEMLTWFTRCLERQRLNETDFKRMLKHGEGVLPAFYEEGKDLFSAKDISERDFRDQGVVVGDVPLTGKIDRMAISDKEILVSDFKTGGSFASWEPSDQYEKIKAWRYRGQLIFYKLLIEHSRDFGGAYFVNRGFIEFVEPMKGKPRNLELDIDPAEVERMKAIIGAVYKKIKALDFPDVSKYSKDLRGIQAFEEDLLTG